MIYPTSKFLTRLNKIILPLRIQRGKSFKILRLLKICRFGRCVYFAPAGAASPQLCVSLEESENAEHLHFDAVCVCTVLLYFQFVTINIRYRLHGIVGIPLSS